jgi:hypothetical protein
LEFRLLGIGPSALFSGKWQHRQAADSIFNARQHSELTPDSRRQLLKNATAVPAVPIPSWNSAAFDLSAKK